MSAFSFDGLNLNDGTTYTVRAAGTQPLRPAALRHVVTPYAATARTATLARPPAALSVTLAILVAGDLAAGTLGTNVDALLRVLSRPQKLLSVTLGTAARRCLATMTAIEPGAVYPGAAEFTVTFTAESSYWETAAPSGNVQTGALSSLVALGLETGNAYGHRLSLTPGGNAPTTPRVLIAVQAGSQSPTRFTIRSQYQLEGLTVSQTLAAGTLLSFEPTLQRAMSLVMTSVVGYWPLAESGGTLRDFSSNSRDLSHTGNYKTAVTADTPRGWWRFEEISGTTASDSYGTNHGTYQNSPTLGVTGLISEAATYAVTLNGTNQYISVPDAPALDLADTFTLELWLRRGSTLGTNQVLLDKNTNGYQIRFNTSNQVELLKSNVAVIVASTTAITDTAVHHVVVTKTGATVCIYIDGVDRTGTVSNQTCADTATALTIGVNTGGTQWFHGTPDDVAVYNTALSADRVLAHYTAGTAADNVLYLQDGPQTTTLHPAIDCDGVSGEFTSASAAFALTSHVSCGAWVSADAIGAVMGILGKAANLGGFALWVTAAGLLTGGIGTGAATRTATGVTTLAANRWYHAVLVWDATAYSVTLYLNGEKEAVTTGGALTLGGYSGDLRVGSTRDLSATIRYWNGKWGEPFVLSLALTQTQVRNIYKRGLIEYGGTVQNRLGQWPQLHGEGPDSTTPYELRVTHATTPPDLRTAVIWRGMQVTP